MTILDNVISLMGESDSQEFDENAFLTDIEDEEFVKNYDFSSFNELIRNHFNSSSTEQNIFSLGKKVDFLKIVKEIILLPSIRLTRYL